MACRNPLQLKTTIAPPSVGYLATGSWGLLNPRFAARAEREEHDEALRRLWDLRDCRLERLAIGDRSTR